VLGIVVFRLAPFVAWMILTRDLSAATKAILLGLVSVPAAATFASDRDTIAVFFAAAAALAYFGLLGTCVYLLPERVEQGEVSPGAVFALCASLSLVLPGIAARGSARVLLVVFGFEFLLSAYSYVVEVAGSSSRRPTLGDCLFFLIVNPTLVYTSCGERVSEPRLDARGLARAGLGIGALLVHFGLMLLPVMYPQIGEAPHWAEVADVHSYSRMMLLSFLGMVLVYAVHSGVASVQIGVLRMMGYRIPERYRFPLLATSPFDWWRRWNTYVGGWFKTYVFTPCALYLGRRLPRSRNLAKALAVLLTFGVSGVLHELAQFSMGSRVSGVIAELFICHGALLLAWVAGTRAAGVLQRTVFRQARLVPMGLTVMAFSWLIFLHANVAIMRPLVDALGGEDQRAQPAPASHDHPAR